MPFPRLILVLIPLLLSACGARDIIQHRMPSAIVNEYFQYSFDVESNWTDWSYDSHFFKITDGDMSPGMDITSRGNLMGIPLTTGVYDFKVAVYGVDDDWWDWEDDDWLFDDDDTDWLDSEWFTLFVTDASSNADCPLPSSTGQTELYICAGTVTKEVLAAGDSFDLDLNFHVDPENSRNYLVSGFSFTISYDPTLFAFEANDLSTNTFSDLPKLYEASATFDDNKAGLLTITLTTGNEDWHQAGRLLNIPVQVLTDMPAGTTLFTVGEVSITTMEKSTATPTFKGINGSITVERSLQ